MTLIFRILGILTFVYANLIKTPENKCQKQNCMTSICNKIVLWHAIAVHFVSKDTIDCCSKIFFRPLTVGIHSLKTMRYRNSYSKISVILCKFSFKN